MKLMIMGPPGAGKGTQAHMISELLRVPHISMGEILREIEKKDTPLGNQVRSVIDKGMLLPDDLTFRILQDRISKTDCADGYILDGYPRRLSQAQDLNSIAVLDAVFELVVGDEENVKRISSRRVCSECGENFNIIFIKPRMEGVCDDCGGELVRREDADPSIVKERLKIYHHDTQPLSDYYKEKGILIRINGEPSIQEVFEEIKQRISALRLR